MKKISYCLLAMVLFTTGVSAQVTIGSGKVPEKYSLLELVSHNKLGVRLPQIETTELRDDILTDAEKTNPLSQGLQIYNMETRCVETWNGSVWIQACPPEGPYVPPTPPILLTCGDQSIPVPEFMPYNLGADPSLDTPKKQMAYLASAGSTTTTNHGRVFGGRYQWGRKNHEYAINADYTLNAGTTKAAALNNPTYDENGQILTNNGINATDLHIYGGTNWNWAAGLVTQDRDKLWGNGEEKGTATTSPGGILYRGNTYQSPVKGKGDPCPTGWRVPTQDEWERLGAYDCNPIAAGSFNTSSYGRYGTIPNANSPFIWVPVVCGGGGSYAGKCIASNDWDYTGTNTGYAIYKKEDWENRPVQDPNVDLLSTTAISPEPFLFLPSAGQRRSDTGTVDRADGSAGYYWSSTVKGVDAHQLAFDSWRVSLADVDAYPRGMGNSVRCVADN